MKNYSVGFCDTGQPEALAMEGIEIPKVAKKTQNHLFRMADADDPQGRVILSPRVIGKAVSYRVERSWHFPAGSSVSPVAAVRLPACHTSQHTPARRRQYDHPEAADDGMSRIWRCTEIFPAERDVCPGRCSRSHTDTTAARPRPNPSCTKAFLYS